MRTPLWIPSEERRRVANITGFIDEVNARYKLNLDSYKELYQWSVENIPDFWATVWNFAEIKASKPYDQVIEDITKLHGAKWFPDARLNFAENLLRYRDDQLAFIFKGETQISKHMTYVELYDSVVRFAHSLRALGVVVGDRVVGYMPNLIETAVAMLAATSLGATWSSCATDHYENFLSKENNPEIPFEQLPFDHPLYIMFSSGTTGKPKCMVQGAGGVLINHLKELLLHTDLKRSDRIFYITSCSWMMWNWLLSSLAVGATIVLYDGNPNYPDPGAMWKLIQDEQITIFGCSASYLHFLKKEEISPRRNYDLSSLREISQTGSPLSAEGFEYVYSEIKPDLHFNSISGGTDINGCFAAGSPILPVYAGELQSAALGMKIKAYDEKGNPIYDEQGELVCEAPAPSMPIYFWNDPDGSKYHHAYFDVYPNVWRHGDYILIHSDTGGVTFYGRSDAVLKPSGVRIGTAEIYAQMEKLAEIADSLAIGQNYKEDQRVILFVKLATGFTLTDELKDKIRKTLRENASPRHVPALILETPDIPYTLNMKKVESAVTNIINGRAVSNKDALINPSSLDYYEQILPQLK